MSERSMMKTILIAKAILIVTTIFLFQGWVKIGDLNLMAADDKQSESPKREDSKKSDTEKPTGSENADDSEKSEKEKAADGQRRSFLSDLFTLPKLNA